MLYLSDEGLAQRSLSIFRSALERLGWTDGKTVRIEYRFTNDGSLLPLLANELVLLQPDVLFASTTPSVVALKRVTDTIPIVFVSVANPLATGIVQDLARPGGNITGFANSVGATPIGKLLELLRELTPNISRVALMFNPDTSAGGGSPAVSQFLAVCKVLSIEAIIAHVRDDAGIEAAIAALVHEPKGGLVLTQDAYVAIHRTSIIASAARHQVPVAYPFSFYCSDGGLISYGVDPFVGHREAATYVNRILKGEKAGDLPVQQPTKLELVINLKTAKALGLIVPPTLLARADEVIE